MSLDVACLDLYVTVETALLLADWQSACQNCNGCVKLCIEEAASVSVAATLKITRAGQPHDPVPPLCLSGLAEQGLPQYVSMVPARAPGVALCVRLVNRPRGGTTLLPPLTFCTMTYTTSVRQLPTNRKKSKTSLQCIQRQSQVHTNLISMEAVPPRHLPSNNVPGRC